MYSEGLIYTEGNLGFKIDWASLWWEGNLPFLLCLQIPSTSPPGIYIRRGNLTEGFLRYEFGGLIFGVAYTWRGLFSEFYGILTFTLGREDWVDKRKTKSS